MLGFEESTEANIHLDLLIATPKKVPNLKPLGNGGIHVL